MAIYEKGDKLQKWRYFVSSLKLILPNEIKDISTSSVNKINILYDYEHNAFPVFKLSLVLESSLYYKIIKNKDVVQFYIRLQSYYQYSDSGDQSLYRDYLSGRFDLILDDSDENMKANAKREASRNDFNKMMSSDENDLVMKDNTIDFFLFKKSHIKGLKKNINKILVNSSISDALLCIFKKAGLENILMSPPDNTKKYDELVIPPMTCIDAIRFLDTYYGIYKFGSMIFFSFGKTYFLSYGGNCTAYTSDERHDTIIVVPMETPKHTIESGVLKKKSISTKYYVVADYKTISIKNESESNDVLNGNDITMVDSISGESTSSSSSAIASGGNSEKILENTTENKWLPQTYSAQTSANQIVIDMHIQNYYLNYLKPNKKFSIVFEDPALMRKYKGLYQLCSLDNAMINDGDDLSLTTTARFKKVM